MKEKLTKRSLKRIERSKLNTTVGLITSILMGIFSFVERTIFNQYFIEDYLGLYSFNYNIIYTLGYIELGLSTSIAFALYKPIEYNDKSQIIAIMRFFRKAYIAIGTFIIITGICLLPFLQYLVQTSIPITNVRVYFVIFLVANASSYIIAYKNVLFSANQEDYILTLITNVSWTLLYIAEIIVAITTQNFLYYSIALFCGYQLKNFTMRFLANKSFKFLKTKEKPQISSDTMRMIKLNTKGMIYNRLGQVMVSTTDSVLISSMVGTAILGKFSNYQMLYSGLITLALLIPKSITASIGNAGVTETKKTMVKSFYSLDLGSFFVYGFLTIMLICVANPIVSTFFGKNRVLDMSTVILYFCSFYLASQRELLLSYKSSLGLYWEDRHRPILEGITNLVASLILGFYWGINGILIGTIISQVFVNYMMEPLIVFHKGFKHSAYWYYISSSLRFILVIAITAICLIATNACSIMDKTSGILQIGSFSIPLGGFIQIIINFTISLGITFISFFLIFYKSESSKMIVRTLKVAFLNKAEKVKLAKHLEEKEKNRKRKNS